MLRGERGQKLQVLLTTFRGHLCCIERRHGARFRTDDCLRNGPLGKVAVERVAAVGFEGETLPKVRRDRFERFERDAVMA